MFLLKVPMQGLYEMNLFFSPMTFRFKALIRYRKLAIILIPVGESEGDDVIPRVGDVALHAVRRVEPEGLQCAARCGGHFHLHLAEVLGEGHH